MKKNILFLTVCLIFFASCTIEKRLYRPGWNINSSFTLKSGHSKNNIAKNVEEDIQNQNTSETRIGSKTINHETKPDDVPQIIHIETSHSDETHTKEDHFINREISNSLKVSSLSVRSNNYLSTQPAREIKKSSQQKMKSKTESSSGNGAIKGIGWFFIILGIIIVLFVSILIGILLMLLGLLFFVVGRSS